jgi:NADPH2:quinone reductase
MKAYITREYGTDARFELAEIETPKPGEGEILIDVKATSINPIDNKLLRHELGFNPELPAVLHGDVAGVVSAVGPNVHGFEIGDEIYACAGGFIGTPGALAEYMPADERLVAHKPKSLSFVEAAALPLVVLTAWESLIDSAKIQAGEHVLVHGGTGGVGHVGVQLAKAKGARVAATVSSEDKAEIASSLGADDIINYREETVDSYVQRLTDGRGFDVVYDTVSGPVFDQSLNATRNRGRIITVFTGTESTTLDLMNAFIKAATVHTQNMSIPLITGEGREHHGEILREAAKLADAGKLKPLIDPNRFTFTQANEAHALFESNKHVGKIVLEAGEWD